MNKTIKRSVLGLGAALTTLLLIGLFLPGRFSVSHSATISAPLQTVFHQVTNLRQSEKWSFRDSCDKTITRTYGPVSNGRGGSYSWLGKLSGRGRVTISQATAYSTILLDYDFDKEGSGQSVWNFEKVGEAIKVSIRYSGRFSAITPFGKFFTFLRKRSEAKRILNYELAQIKALCEGSK